MRLFSLVSLIALVGCAPLEAQSFSLPKDWEGFAKARGLRLTASYVPTSSTRSWNVTSKPIDSKSLPTARVFWKYFQEEFGKYPTAFLKRVGLKEINFVTRLAVGGMPVKAMPDYVNERLVLDVDMADDEWYSRHVVHHEFYHLVEEQMFGSAYYKDPVWAAMNTKGFKYGNGGASAQNPEVTPLTHPHPGFINLYSESGLEEDKAEMWTVVMFGDDWRTVSPWMKKDAILRKKAEYLEKFAKKTCPEMDAKFFTRIRKG